MSKSDDAYAEAGRLIAKAKAMGETNLHFNSAKTHALAHLPDEIADLPALVRLSLVNTDVVDISALAALTNLQILFLNKTPIIDIAPLVQLTALNELYLDTTQIVDIAPLAKLTGLRKLSLQNTPILDLRPLRNLTSLANDPNLGGLTFKNTAATNADPRIAEIARIKYPATRAHTLFAYLENWVPPGEIPTPPKPDPIFETILINGQLELAADPPTQAERTEALKRALHERLQTATPDLARAAGNVFPKLASKARVLAALAEKPFDQLDLLSIHFEVETLHDRLTRGTEDSIPFPDDVLGPLSDVTRTGPGLTLGHPAVDLYVLRTREAREHPMAAQDDAIHLAMSEAITQDTAANGPISIAMEARIASLDDPAQRQTGWKEKHKWLAWTLATTGHLSNAVTVGSAAGAGATLLLGVPISNFLVTNAPVLTELALTYGAPFATWFGAVMGPIFLALGVKQDIVKRLNKPK